MTQSRSKIRVRRASRRGAALVEAAVVIPVMLVFLGLIMFTYRSYAMKMEQQAELRASVLSYASHDCEGQALGLNDLPASIPKGGSSPGPIDGPAANLNLKERGIGDFTPGVNRTSGVRSAIVYGSATNNGRLFGFSSVVRTQATVACNQKAYSSSVWGLLDAMGGMATGGGKSIF